MAQSVDITARKGDTWSGLDFELKVNGSPKNLTGAEIKIQFRRGLANGSVQKEISNGDGVTITDSVNGLFSIDPFVVDFPVGSYRYDIQFTFSPTEIKTYVEGIFRVTEDITF